MAGPGPTHLVIYPDSDGACFRRAETWIDPDWLGRGGRYRLADEADGTVQELRFGFGFREGPEVIPEFLSAAGAEPAPPDLMAFLHQLAELTQPLYDRPTTGR